MHAVIVAMSSIGRILLTLLLLMPALASAQSYWDTVTMPTPRLVMNPHRLYAELGRGILNLPGGNGLGASSFMLGFQACDGLRIEARGVLSDGRISGRGAVRTIYYTVGVSPMFRLSSPPVFQRGSRGLGILYPFISLTVGGGMRQGYLRDVRVHEPTIHGGFRTGWHLLSWLDFYMGYDFYIFPRTSWYDEDGSGYASVGVRFCLF